MNRINLLISHKDKEYASALCKSLALRDPIYTVTLASQEISGFQGVIEKLSENQYDLLLVDREWKEQAHRQEIINRERLLGLTEMAFPAETEGYIYKYGGLDRICSELQIAYAEITGRSRIHLQGNQTKLMGFTSSAGGVGTSCIAISAARELASFSQRDVLYLSFEEIESTPVYIPMDEGRSSISEYLYYFFTAGKEAIASFIHSFLISDPHGLCAFRPAKGVNELPDLSPELLSRFLDSLCKSGCFRYIFIDFPARTSPEAEQVMKYCHRIFVIDDGRPLSLWKNRRFIENISMETFEEIEERISVVTNKWTPQEESLLEENRFFIEYDEESFIKSDFCIEISLQRRFGLGVRKIADELETKV